MFLFYVKQSKHIHKTKKGVIKMKIMRLVKKAEKEYDLDNFYSDDTRDLLLEDDELKPDEAAFMEGWDGASE